MGLFLRSTDIHSASVRSLRSRKNHWLADDAGLIARHIPRPLHRFVTTTLYSFPSGLLMMKIRSCGSAGKIAPRSDGRMISKPLRVIVSIRGLAFAFSNADVDVARLLF